MVSTRPTARITFSRCSRFHSAPTADVTDDLLWFAEDAITTGNGLYFTEGLLAPCIIIPRRWPETLHYSLVLLQATRHQDWSEKWTRMVVVKGC